MSRIMKVAIWTAVFLGAAGIGAYIGAHAELFPPAVEGTPSATATATPSGTGPVDPVWKGTIRSTGSHQLYVGGSCSTRWETRLTITALDNGRLVGTGTARLDGHRVCTFPNAQVNAERIEVSVEGAWDAGALAIRLIDGERSPAGTADYGGFAPTVFAEGARSVLHVPVSGDTAMAKIRLHRVDEGGRGTYLSANTVALSCSRCGG